MKAIPISPVFNIYINGRGTYSVVFLPKSYSWRFEGALRVEIILDQETKKLGGWISYKSLFYTSQITGINISKFSRGGIYQTEIQAEILQNSQEVEVLNQNNRKWVNLLQKNILYVKNYRHKDYKILKRRNLSEINTGRDIAKFPRGRSFKSK